MPTRRTVALGNGQTMLGGLDYATSEACEWFLHGAADREDLTPSDDMRAAWARWVEACREVWAERAPSPGCGFGPEMPDTFPMDAMHEAQGAGVGVDSDREWADGMTDEQIAHLAAPFERLTWWGTDLPTLRAIFCEFEDETQNCIPEES